METPQWVGKYEIEQFLGGGMSHVYRAKDSVLGRRVALKMLTDTAMADPLAKARFLEEARTASNLRHDNIISVYDFGEDNGRPFMVMEFLEGESLRDAIAHQSLGKVERRLGIALQIGRAIDYIHTRKIVHRDIKPENVHVDLTGKAKLMDFGIAKNGHQQGDTAGTPPQPGTTLGTPYYMAPEQVLGRPLTPHADIYAFGVMLYEILTGVKAVNADTVEKIFQQVIYEPLKLEPLAASGVPVPVIALIGRCAAKQMVQRPSNLGVVCDEIERILKDEKASPEKKTAPQVPEQQIEPPVQAPPPSAAPTVPVHLGPPRWVRGQAITPVMIQRLPKEMQSPISLMILACGGVVFFAMLLYAFLLRLHVI